MIMKVKWWSMLKNGYQKGTSKPSTNETVEISRQSIGNTRRSSKVPMNPLKK